VTAFFALFKTRSFWGKAVGVVLVLAIVAAPFVALIRAQAANDDLQRTVMQRDQTIADQKDTIAALTVELTAKETASRERQDDTDAVAQIKEQLTDAIKDMPAGKAPSPAAVAVGCERLRQAGRTASAQYLSICGRR